MRAAFAFAAFAFAFVGLAAFASFARAFVTSAAFCSFNAFLLSCLAPFNGSISLDWVYFP